MPAISASVERPKNPKVPYFLICPYTNNLEFDWNGKQISLNANYANGRVGFAAIGCRMDVWWVVFEDKNAMIFLRHIERCGNVRGPLLYSHHCPGGTYYIFNFKESSENENLFEKHIASQIRFRRFGYVNPLIQYECVNEEKVEHKVEEKKIDEAKVVKEEQKTVHEEKVEEVVEVKFRSQAIALLVKEVSKCLSETTIDRTRLRTLIEEGKLLDRE